MKNKKKILFTILIVAMIFIPISKANAALQSNGGTPATKNVNDWITQIRQMQATGGTLGLTDSINGTNLTSGNKNLDIHMQKNTEYGAMAILSASAYGNPNKIADGQTTTGNQTGVVMKINKEWVAAGTNNSESVSFKNAANRYKNQYTAPDYTEKKGDAIDTIGGWHGSTNTIWLSTNMVKNINKTILIRSYSGSIFSYYGYGFETGGESSDAEHRLRDAHYKKEWSSRAVVVTGSGI